MTQYPDPPPRNISFVRTKDYENVLRRAADHPVVVLTGQNGIGKRWTARQVLRELWKTNNASNKRFHEFSINAMDTTKADVDRMLADYGLSVDLELSSCRNVSHLLLRAFQNLDEQCANFHKYCLLDITNLGGEVIANEFLSEFLEEFCDKLSRNDQNRSKWRILVVTTKEKDIKPVKYAAIKTENFYALKGFDVENIKSLIERECVDIGNIKRMMDLECEDYGDDVVDSYARLIHDKLRVTVPKNVCLVVNDMDSSIEETPEDFASNYMPSLQLRASSSDDTETNEHANSLDDCKLNLLKCFGKKDKAKRKKICAMLSMIDGDVVPSELLKAFHETLAPEDEKLVPQKVHDLMGCLKHAGLCDGRQESRRSQVLYRIRPFVQEAMAMFMADYTSTEKLILLKNTLVALVRRMPKEGRDLHPQLIQSFLNIGHKVNECIKQMLFELRGDCEEPHLVSLIKILHCELLVAMGYCLITQQNTTVGERYFLLALDKYNEAVDSPKSYRHIDEFNKQLVQPLYDKGQRAPFLSEEIFRLYVDDVPRYDVITPNSLHHMPRITSADLVNGHMSRLAFDELRKHGRLLVTSHDETEALVVDIDKSVQVYMGELLVRILASWSKVYASVNGGQGKQLEISRYIELAQQACNICDTIYNTLNVHLLHKLVTRRVLLRYRLHTANDHDMADDLYRQWNGLHGGSTTLLTSLPTDSESEVAESTSTQTIGINENSAAEFTNSDSFESGTKQTGPELETVEEQTPAELVERRTYGQALTVTGDGRQDPTEAGDGGQDPTEAADGRQDPTETGDGGQDPTEAGDDRQGPTEAGDGGQDPTETGDGGQDPTESGVGGQVPTETGDGGQDSTETGDGGQDPTEAGDGGQDPTETGDGGQVPTETKVYASGLLRSVLEQDQYHQLSCLTWQLLAIGKKRQHSEDPRLYKQQGTKQMDGILELISQLFPGTLHISRHHGALSKAYRVFAEYHFYCGDMFSAIRNIIRSLEHLRLSSPEGKLDPMSVPFTHLMHNYDKYRSQCASSLQPFVGGEEEEAGYLLNIINNLKAVGGQNQAGEGPYEDTLHLIKDEIVAVERVETQSHEVSEHSVDEQSGATGVQQQGATTACRNQPTDSDDEAFGRFDNQTYL